jgi:hypothetical protein
VVSNIKLRKWRTWSERDYFSRGQWDEIIPFNEIDIEAFIADS